jgi:bile acid:Na+ symporter, BASS family
MSAELTGLARTLLGLALIVFMAGNLFDTGLKLDLRQTAAAMRNARFGAVSFLWCFVAGPLFALALTRIFPLAQPFAAGLLFLGLAPCAPFMPAMAQKAGARLGDVAAFMLLASSGTIVFMPLLAPVLIAGFPASAWTIAKPLLLYVALPAACGVVARLAFGPRATALQPVTERITAAATVLMLVLLAALYWRDFVNMPGTFSIVTLVLFCALLPAAAYSLGFGLDHSQRSVLAMGLCTRNIGAAIAPLFAYPATDPRAIAICAMAVPVTLVCAAIAARIFARSRPATLVKAGRNSRDNPNGTSAD